MTWPIEPIPDPEKLFYRIHKQDIRDGYLKPKVIQERGMGEEKGMSTDWEEYSSPEMLIGRARNPTDCGIISFIAGFLRHISLKVIHAPFDENRAHTNVIGIPDDLDDIEIRIRMLDAFTWEILPPVHVNNPAVT